MLIAWCGAFSLPGKGPNEEPESLIERAYIAKCYLGGISQVDLNYPDLLGPRRDLKQGRGNG